MSLKQSDVVNVLEIVNLALVHGTPLVLDIMNSWSSEEEITPAMIAKLRAEIKPAADLFPELDEE